MITRRRLLVSTLALAPLASSVRADTTNWPERPVKILVGFPPGQGSDIAARIYADELRKALGQPFVIDNRPGAGATLAANLVAKAVPDGYTLLFTSSGPLTIAPHLYDTLGFDAMKDLTPLALVGRSPLLLLVRSDSPVKTLPELVSLAGRRDLNCGSGGNGVTNHLALEMFKIASGAKFVHVPYKGAAPAMTDLMGGQIDMMFETTSAALVHVRAGRLRALAVSSPTRYADLPDVPTVAEFYPGFDATTWAMYAAPTGTPKAILDKLATQLNVCMDNPSIREKLKQAGIEATPGTSQTAAKRYAVAEFEKWGAIIKRADVKLE